ncbi:MAG TPA: hypothetical protein VNA24_22795 [Hyalangium sp.]|nr:hypothetical protein [Hyalangium sp.]
MSETQSPEQELAALRLSAEHQDRNACWDATRKLLHRLPARIALQFSQDFVARRLHCFERHQPGVSWPREFIESISETGPAASSKTWPEAEDDFAGPGANSFTSAVEALWKASRFAEDEQQRSELLADAIVGAINAERLEYWGTLHPEEWARWYQLAASGSDDMSQYHTLLTIMKDRGAMRVERAAWSEAIHHLEEALSASTHESH